jgi:hypothetical protein
MNVPCKCTRKFLLLLYKLQILPDAQNIARHFLIPQTHIVMFREEINGFRHIGSRSWQEERKRMFPSSLRWKNREIIHELVDVLGLIFLPFFYHGRIFNTCIGFCVLTEVFALLKQSRNWKSMCKWSKHAYPTKSIRYHPFFFLLCVTFVCTYFASNCCHEEVWFLLTKCQAPKKKKKKT